MSFKETDGVRRRSGEISFVAVSPRIVHDPGVLHFRSRILVEGGVVTDLIRSTRLFIKEEALDGRVKSRPAIHVRFDFCARSFSISGTHVTDGPDFCLDEAAHDTGVVGV